MMNAAGQTDNSDAHFYIIDSVGCTNGGISLPASDGRRLVVIDDNWNPSSGFSEHSSRILAHELGHAKNLGHVNGGSSDDCSDPLFSRNLMCAATGRIMVDSPVPALSQCDIVYRSTRYTDRN